MAENFAPLKPVDRLEITILVDNSIDVFLPSTAEVRRPQIPSDLPWGERKALLSEHGYSALVRVHKGDRSASLLFDAEISTDARVTQYCSESRSYQSYTRLAGHDQATREKAYAYPATSPMRS